MKWFKGKKRLIKKALGSAHFRARQHLFDSIGSFSNLPKVGDLTGDCTEANHEIATIKIFWEPLYNINASGKRYYVGKILTIEATAYHNNEHPYLVCDCLFGMSFQPPRSRQEIVEYFQQLYSENLPVPADSPSDSFEISVQEFFLSMGILTFEDVDQIVDERGLFLDRYRISSTNEERVDELHRAIENFEKLKESLYMPPHEQEEVERLRLINEMLIRLGDVVCA